MSERVEVPTGTQGETRSVASAPSPLPPPPDAGRIADGDARRELLELAIEAAGVGTFDWDLVDGTLAWDERLVELFGYGPAALVSTIEAFDERLHPDDQPRVSADLQTAIATCGRFSAEYRIVLPGGDVRWVGARGRALGDERGVAVRLLGAAWDVTAHREAERRVTRVLESMSTAFFSLDTSWRFTYVNAQAERVLGRERRELLGGVVWDLFPAAPGSDFEVNYRRAMESGETVTFDAHYPAPLNAWYEVRAWRTGDGLAVYFLDVTEQRRAQHESERAARRTELLGRITAELTGTLDNDEAARRLARLVVPALADWAIVTLVDDTHQAGTRRGLRDAAACHRDPALEPVLEEYAHARMRLLTDDTVVVRAMTTGRPQLLPTGATAAVQAMLPPGPVREQLGLLAPESVVVLPLTGREGPVGVLSLANGAERGDFSADDLVTVEHVGARAGIVLDNARLYRQQRDLAETLQRSLLTALPEPEHLQVVARYQPAAQAAQVGGDWYDAFLQPDGATVLVIGDVVGHDTQAAAAMSQVRTLVRGIAAAGGGAPAEVLRTVDRVVHTLRVDTTATAVVARLEHDEALPAGATRMRWSSAGHPPPMVISPAGRVRALSGEHADLLLGVLPDAPREEFSAVLEHGSTVLMYTDGLVERRGQSLEEGLDLLRRTLTELAAQGSDLDALCDGLLARMLPGQQEDDVAVVAVHLHPRD
ncbi:SpoIIE family protein phosphatase [Paenibacillus sp. TRM 82003]|uniref:SpoIIE family protein phosphatase n=1 Tax=Kineococcus sp. TRM81007 TaxID=2925831 RepID=UPI001F577F1E|nr:SpoIIE family protein phosphatase [Kineococcus sp. TRM81007]MCI2237002.1 SpoIIE family protein phosphatase [Kineococcus sp. TRM81007]MCI3926603.1 SpoIIE family protein phosphatase [Paenibacillus sp. TRM 82003]